MRLRRVEGEELGVFKSFAMRPSPYASLKAEIDTTIQSLGVREESKTLFERAFQLLINMDQRLERIEEQLLQMSRGEKAPVDSYEWIHADLGAGGLVFEAGSQWKVSAGDSVLLDLILPALPEYRLVAAAEIKDGGAPRRFEAIFTFIHDDDREFIHRFVMSRERELLRARALERDRGGEIN